jgi:hypothetical protein
LPVLRDERFPFLAWPIRYNATREATRRFGYSVTGGSRLMLKFLNVLGSSRTRIQLAGMLQLLNEDSATHTFHAFTTFTRTIQVKSTVTALET